jgi:hypothetical protein
VTETTNVSISTDIMEVAMMCTISLSSSQVDDRNNNENDEKATNTYDDTNQQVRRVVTIITSDIGSVTYKKGVLSIMDDALQRVPTLWTEYWGTLHSLRLQYEQRIHKPNCRRIATAVRREASVVVGQVPDSNITSAGCLTPLTLRPHGSRNTT